MPPETFGAFQGETNLVQTDEEGTTSVGMSDTGLVLQTDTDPEFNWTRRSVFFYSWCRGLDLIASLTSAFVAFLAPASSFIATAFLGSTRFFCPTGFLGSTRFLGSTAFLRLTAFLCLTAFLSLTAFLCLTGAALERVLARLRALAPAVITWPLRLTKADVRSGAEMEQGVEPEAKRTTAQDSKVTKAPEIRSTATRMGREGVIWATNADPDLIVLGLCRGRRRRWSSTCLNCGGCCSCCGCCCGCRLWYLGCGCCGCQLWRWNCFSAGNGRCSVLSAVFAVANSVVTGSLRQAKVSVRDAAEVEQGVEPVPSRAEA